MTAAIDTRPDAVAAALAARSVQYGYHRSGPVLDRHTYALCPLCRDEVHSELGLYGLPSEVRHSARRAERAELVALEEAVRVHLLKACRDNPWPCPICKHRPCWCDAPPAARAIAPGGRTR